MRKVIFCSREGGETRVCMLVSGKLVNIDAEGQHAGSLARNIYRGKVTGVSRSLNAAFVSIGEGKEGFLSIQDVHPAILAGYPRGAGMQDIFNSGQEILVQVVRDAVKEKGPVLTTCISLPGRYLVLIPAVERTGISKKLPEDERQRLRDIISEVEIPEGFGVIVRTAGRNQRREEMLADLNQLVAQWKHIESAYMGATAPALLVREQTVAARFLREYFTDDVAEVLVEGAGLQQEILDALSDVMPRLQKVVKLYSDPMPLFVRYGIEAQIEKMFLRDVPLPSGGRIVIDRTEALTAIDVNSGRTRTKDVEDTALQTNLEAAEEIANQLMLRDLGGLVVVDFIDMASSKNRKKVQDLFEKCFEEDKARVNFGKISQFGLLEMTRQRMRSGVVTQGTRPCPRCDGVGYIRSVPSSALQILRRIRELAVSGNGRVITVTAPVEVANFMQNGLRDSIYALEKERGIRISVLADPTVHVETIDQTAAVQEQGPQDQTATAQPAPAEPAATDVPASEDGGQKPGRDRKQRGRGRGGQDQGPARAQADRAAKGQDRGAQQPRDERTAKGQDRGAQRPREDRAAKGQDRDAQQPRDERTAKGQDRGAQQPREPGAGEEPRSGRSRRRRRGRSDWRNGQEQDQDRGPAAASDALLPPPLPPQAGEAPAGASPGQEPSGREAVRRLAAEHGPTAPREAGAASAPGSARQGGTEPDGEPAGPRWTEPDNGLFEARETLLDGLIKKLLRIK